MKVYVMLEITRDDFGGDNVSFGVFDTFEKAKAELVKRNKKLYRNYDVEENLKISNYAEYQEYDEVTHDVDYHDDYGSYYLEIKEMEVQ